MKAWLNSELSLGPIGDAHVSFSFLLCFDDAVDASLSAPASGDLRATPL